MSADCTLVGHTPEAHTSADCTPVEEAGSRLPACLPAELVLPVEVLAPELGQEPVSVEATAPELPLSSAASGTSPVVVPQSGTSFDSPSHRG